MAEILQLRRPPVSMIDTDSMLAIYIKVAKSFPDISINIHKEKYLPEGGEIPEGHTFFTINDLRAKPGLEDFWEMVDKALLGDG